jgi:hypothetical protein
MPAVEPTPEDEEATPDEQPALNPLEAVRRAQAKRSLPPGSHPEFGRGGTRNFNPKAPRHYNRHK